MAIRDYKPAASARQHLLMAALMWTVVASGLGCFGVRWVLGGSSAAAPWVLAGAAATGILKSVFILDRAAARIAGRIESRGDGRCIGGFLSVRSWMLVAGMAGGGRLLRATALPPQVAGFLYAAVAVALLLSSRRFWEGRQALRTRP